jgi:general secretion pathway protein A
MYCDFYGFKEKPFTITPNPRFVFLSKNHKEAFAHLLYGIDHHAGFIALTGEVGTGKTTVLRTLLSQLDEASHRTALILNPCLSAPELLRSINREFGIAWEGLTGAELLENLNRFLLAENKAGRTVVLVIDEAQNLEPQVLEQIRLISNLETETDKLIQIVLAGQPELVEILRRPELRQLGQRITVRYHLPSLDFDDTKAYIDHRLEIAGGWRAATFTPGALTRIFRHSGGTPRLINIICDRALLVGYIEESREISGRMAARAIAEVREKRRLPYRIIGLALGVGVAFLLAVTAFHFPRGMRKLPFATPAVNASIGAGTGNTAAGKPHILEELGKTTETESAVNAFNALAKRWNAPPLSGPDVTKIPEDLERPGGRQGVRLARFSGSLGLLLRADTPALLEFILPGTGGRRYLALTGTDNGRFLIAPPLQGHTSLGSAELEKIWSGRAYLSWKNFRDIPPLDAGMQGEEVSRLQQLLHEAGSYTGKITGRYDRETAAAIRSFQASCGIAPDGRAGTQTLLFLYHAGKGFAAPRLEKKGGGQPG